MHQRLVHGLGSRHRIKLVASVILIIIFSALLYASASPFLAQPSLSVNTYVKKQVMAATYKMYANPEFSGGAMWLCRTVFKNEGPIAIYDLKASYKITTTGLTEYPSEWSTPEPYEMLVPGETVVDLFYAAFPTRILDLSTTSPSQLSIKWTYSTASGQTYEGTKNANFDLLARNEIVYTSLAEEEYTGTWYDKFDNNWALASWVTPNEQVLRDFVGKYVSGFAPSTDDKAIKMWARAFDAMGKYGIQYMYTPTSPWDSKEAYQITQVIKFPRDILQSKAGTCIELSILMDSIAEAYSVPTYLFLIPGHCIPVLVLPESGDLLPLEATMVGQADAQTAMKTAIDEVKEAMASGPYIFVDVEAMWKAGVIPPE